MENQEAKKLKHGLYEIYWESGGSSLAAVGILHSGQRWYAPVNWTWEDDKYEGVPGSSDWSRVRKAILITNQKGQGISGQVNMKDHIAGEIETTITTLKALVELLDRDDE